MKLDRQKNFRLSAAEAELLRRAVAKAGVTESQWLRLVVLTALGKTELVEQLSRVADAAVRPQSQRATKTKSNVVSSRARTRRR
jgi:hypothetical protein